MAKILEFSENGRKEYCATIVRIGELHPIEGSDFLCRTVVDGFDVVIRKDEVNTGDVMVYAQNETMLNKKFLGANNLFDIGEYEQNANRKEVQKLIDEGKKDEAKKLVGFFNKHGRVKMIRLRGCPSMGFLFGKDALVKWNRKLESLNLEEHIGEDFDTVLGELFIKVYVPPLPPQPERKSKDAKRNKKLQQFDRIIPGEFAFHYDTEQLNRAIDRISPDSKIFVTVKVHGTSVIISNVKVRTPLQLNSAQKLLNKSIIRAARKQGKKHLLKKLVPKCKIGYGNVYSSRSVIKNKYINQGVNSGFYGVDVWKSVNDWLFPHIPKGMTVYGEIVGYIDGCSTMIQKGYDYGCAPGENKFMAYRITTDTEDGRKREWEMTEVNAWLRELMKNKEMAKRILPLTVLYHGKAKDLYPELNTERHWHEDLLENMKHDRQLLGMEENEPLCNNKVPREGICLRIDGDKVAECFKLKTDAFRMREQKEIDAGNVDIEITAGYGENA